MLQSLPPRWRRLVNSVAYTALVAIVAGLGYLTYRAANERHHPASGSPVPAESENAPPLIELSSFSARVERSTDTERVSISLRALLTTPGTMDCYVYMVARNDHISPKLWAVWPPQGPGGAISTGGHFRVNNPTTGELLHLTPGWTRFTGTVDHPRERPAFDTVMVYVVSTKGEVLLSRPFPL